MRIYSVSANYRPMTNTRMSIPVQPAFKKEQNKSVTLSSGVSYEIDEESIKNFPPKVKEAFYNAVKEVEPHLNKEGDDDIKYLHFIFKGIEKDNKDFPYSMHLAVQCPDIKKFREIISGNRRNYEQGLVRRRKMLEEDAVNFPTMNITRQEINEIIARNTRSDEDYRKLDTIFEAKHDKFESAIYYKDNLGNIGFDTVAMINLILPGSDSKSICEAIFSSILRNKK